MMHADPAGAFEHTASDAASLYFDTARAAQGLGFGYIVDTGSKQLHGVYGTGELTARHLGRYGVAIKVSHGGQVQIYTQPDVPAVRL